MISINGQIADQLTVSDRAFQYGDGCFTTMAYVNGQLSLWSQHLARLQADCQRLAIAFTQWTALEQALHTVLVQVTEANAVIKVVITRGQGGRGYSPLGVSAPSFVISSHPFPSHYADWQQLGINLAHCPLTLAKQPLLAGLKHLNRLEQVLIKQAMAVYDEEDALVCDTDGVIVESSAANVFWLQDGQWYTPSLSDCGVAGVMRQQVIKLLASRHEQVLEVRQMLNASFNADEMFICNALMGVVPVRSLVSRQLAQHWQFDTAVTGQLQHDLTHYCAPL